MQASCLQVPGPHVGSFLGTARDRQPAQNAQPNGWSLTASPGNEPGVTLSASPRACPSPTTSPGNKPEATHSKISPGPRPSPMTSPGSGPGDQVQILLQRPSLPPLGAILAAPGQLCARADPANQQVLEDKWRTHQRYNVSPFGTRMRTRDHEAPGIGHGPKQTLQFKLPRLVQALRGAMLPANRSGVQAQTFHQRPSGPFGFRARPTHPLHAAAGTAACSARRAIGHFAHL